MDIGIIDYGSGNIRSVAKSFERAVIELGVTAKIHIIKNAEELRKMDRIILPGVGSFAHCMHSLKSIEDLFNNTETSIGLLLTTLESFENMRERAADAFPVIEGNLTRLTDNLSQTINGVGENLENMTNQFSESVTENSENIRES